MKLVEKLRLTEEDVFALRRDLDQSREAMCGAESDVRDLGHELEKCQVRLRESEDERRAMEIQFAERLRLLSAELESSKTQVEVPQSKCSQATSPATVLQEHTQGQVDPPTPIPIPVHPQISTHHEPESDIAEAHRAVLRELGERVHPPESESAQDATPIEPDDSNHVKDLTATIKQLRLLKEKVVSLRCSLDHPSTTAINADSLLRDPEASGKSPSQHQKMIEYMRRPEPGSAQDAKPDEHDYRRLEEQMATTVRQLRLAEEEVLTLRRDLDQSEKKLWDVETHANNARKLYRTKLSKTEDARRVLENRLVEAVEDSRLRNAELEASMAEVEASQFKCSQFMFLSAALQERVGDLEGQLKLLKDTRDNPPPKVTLSPSFLVTDTGTVFPPFTQARTLISDFEDVLRDADSTPDNSIYIAIPPSLPYLLHLSLPHSSSRSSDDYFDQHGCSATLPACADLHPRVRESEAEVTLECNRDHPTTTPARIGSHSSLPDTGMVTLGFMFFHIFTSDFLELSHNAKLQRLGSIHITTSPTSPYPPDLSLPHPNSSSRLSDDHFLHFVRHGPSAIPPACIGSLVSPTDTGGRRIRQPAVLKSHDSGHDSGTLWTWSRSEHRHRFLFFSDFQNQGDLMQNCLKPQSAKLEVVVVRSDLVPTASLPGQEPFAVGLGQKSLHGKSPSSPRLRKCRRRVHVRPLDIEKLDYGLPEEFGERIYG